MVGVGPVEAGAGDDEDLGLRQQVPGELFVIGDVELLHIQLGEEIEGTLGLVHLETRNLTTELHDEVTTALEGLAHLLDRLLCATIGSLGSLIFTLRNNLVDKCEKFKVEITKSNDTK